MRVVVVGGGIAGLAAALRLRDELGAAARITVLDQAGRLGGKLRTEAFGDGYSEAGAEAFGVTDPAAVELAGRVGLGDALRHPATGRAALAIAGELVPIPARRPTPTAAGRSWVLGRTWRSARWSGRGWAGRCWTGWSTRSSAGCTPGAATTCRWRRRCRRWP